MSGFDPRWLALREPVDGLARDRTLAEAAADWLTGKVNSPQVLDIGCGTGSTWRALSPVFPKTVRWTLLDNDGTLLAEAARQIGDTAQVSYCQHDLNDIAGLPLDGVSLLTASALFDLCSEDFCKAFVKQVALEGSGVYAALNYDGVMRWSIEHPLDGAVVDAFNRHQRTDKGLGPALGPDAAPRLAALLEAEGYRVRLAESPWRMGPEDAELQGMFLDGFRQPLTEIGNLPEKDIEDWLSFRLEALTAAGSLCEVGHFDLLALPS
ncbi:class I SAM-dependent methyltransferase [Roseibium litorale]|uniref:Class I SAM-dependent methyltransferase n=1 Tax=Roseibium litorale TaxID=2803841 RepID=A0ABR9CK66_9HYPH|nr:class I SAM-dependent methyltransferase [Roseibium litorale]MBD8891240.1 class I SAM-dependent methyltransferase [Roseibium litorale]